MRRCLPKLVRLFLRSMTGWHRGRDDRSVARYELASDTWTELPKVPGAPVLEGLSVVGDSILGDTHPDDPGPASIAALDRTSWTWGEPSVGPLRTLSSGYGAAIDGELLYALVPGWRRCH